MKIGSAGSLLVVLLIITLTYTIILSTITAYGYLQITSPTKGQKVPVGNIVVSGTSSSNSTNQCTVSLNINHVKPNQQAISTGQNGPTDYSTWTFTATPKYAVIKQGLNIITSKYACPNSLTHYYSVNVTGVQGMGIGPGVVGQQNKSPTPTNNRIPGFFPGH
jgi:hypothetical protein